MVGPWRPTCLGATESNLFIQLEDNVLSLHARIDPLVPKVPGRSTKSTAWAITTDRSSSATRSIASESRRNSATASSPRSTQGRSGSSPADRDQVVNGLPLKGGKSARTVLLNNPVRLPNTQECCGI